MIWIKDSPGALIDHDLIRPLIAQALPTDVAGAPGRLSRSLHVVIGDEFYDVIS